MTSSHLFHGWLSAFFAFMVASAATGNLMGCQQPTVAANSTVTPTATPAVPPVPRPDKSPLASAAVSPPRAPLGDCDVVAQLLCSDNISAQTCTMVRKQTVRFPPARCRTMAEHIPEIVRDLKKMEAADHPWSGALKAALTTGPGPEFGPKDSVVQLVEFSDFESPLCEQDADVVQRIRARYGSRVHFVFHQYSGDKHMNPRAATEAALAAHDQGKFWEYYGQLCVARQVLDRPALEKEARKIGLDLNRFRRALDERTFERQVDADFALAEELFLLRPTTLFINGKRFDSPLDFGEIGFAIRAIILDVD